MTIECVVYNMWFGVEVVAFGSSSKVRLRWAQLVLGWVPMLCQLCFVM